MSKKGRKNWKATKTYDEYIEIFKSACDELGRSITPSELEKHKFGLPSAIWLVNNSNENIKSLNDLLESLDYTPVKKHNKHRKYNFEIAFEEFAKVGLKLVYQEYINSAIPLKYICPHHPNIIQYKSLNTLLFDRKVDGSQSNCIFCHYENNYGSNNQNWRGGTSLS